MAPPIVNSRTEGASVQKGPHALSQIFPSARSGGKQRKAQKCEMLMEFAVSRGGAPKNRKLANGKLAENLLCKG